MRYNLLQIKLKEVEGILSFQDTGIETFNGLENLKQTGASFLVMDNPKLQTVSGLANLEHVFGGYYSKTMIL